MKKFTVLSLVILFTINVFSQISYGGQPLSFEKNIKLKSEIDHIVIPAPDLEQINMKDSDRCGNGEGYEVAVLVDTDICNKSVGTTEILADGTKVWRLKISSKGAKAIAMFYDDFYIPEGAELFLYNENRKHIIGAFDYRTNPRHSNRFSTQMIEGDITYIEYIQPPEVVGESRFIINQISYFYRGSEQFVGYYRDSKSPQFMNSDICQVNINCPEGNNWQTEKRGIGISFSGTRLCSGSMVNNTTFDGTPYFLSADHCGGTDGNWDQWQFYFHFEAPGCDNPPTAPSYETLVGAYFRSRGPVEGGTDFLLLELYATLQEVIDISLYYNGWDLSTTGSPFGVSIHHPSADMKKISTYNTPLTTSTPPGGILGSEWEVVWAETETHHGVTEGGSSGSPIFNGNNKLIVGTLASGTSYCDALHDPDYYGKMSVHWEGNGASDDRQLRPWLDPDNSGVESLQGYDPNEEIGDEPVANFVGNPTTVQVGETVNFTDQSTNNPTSWSWTFQNGTPDTSTDQNPTITYNMAGVWDVTLTVSNADGDDTEHKAGYITVIEEGTLVADFVANPTIISVGENVQFTDQSLGDPTSWSWTFQNGIPATSTDQNPLITYNIAGQHNVTLTVSNADGDDTEHKAGYITVNPITEDDLVAAFEASETEIIAGDCINFTDLSEGFPMSWTWNFSGAVPPFSSNQHPTNICYNQPGTYDVCLEIQRGTETDIHCIEDYISVLPNPNLPVIDFVANKTTVIVGNPVQFTNLTENGPMESWSWSFPGGHLTQVNDSAPPPIIYTQIGKYDVELRCKKIGGEQGVKLKENYINVVEEATEVPIAKFEANYTFIPPGQEINFIDFSSGKPHIWNWEFVKNEDGDIETSNIQYPTGIKYDEEGLFKVTLMVSNNMGADTLIKEDYIYVSFEDTCTEPPVVKFSADNRLITAGQSVGFFNQSENNPTEFLWEFQHGNPPMGGTPATSTEATPTNRITYNTPGIYTVKLTASNECGTDVLEKNKYVYVYSQGAYITEHCDTLSNIKAGEPVSPVFIGDELGWGYIAGHNSDNVRGYADHFNIHTFSEVRGLLVSVSEFAYMAGINSSVMFYIWDGNTEKPETILGQKRVYIRDIEANEVNIVEFDSHVEIDGPFFAGFTISYAGGEFLDHDYFVVPVAQRSNDPANNTLYLQRGGNWYSLNEEYGFSGSMAIRPMTCLVDIEEFEDDFNVKVYPNPSTGIVNIDMGDLADKKTEIEVYDLLGKRFNVELKQSYFGEYTINLSEKPEGLYILRIIADKVIITKKIVLSK